VIGRVLITLLVVVVALRLLDLGNGGVGYLFSAVGIGGVLGAAAAVALIGRQRTGGHTSPTIRGAS